MRIEDKLVLDTGSARKLPAGRIPAAVGGQTANVGSAAAPSGEDSVSSLTRHQLSLQALAAGAARSEKLDRLQAEVQSGRYQADPMAVSKALVAEALETTNDDF